MLETCRKNIENFNDDFQRGALITLGDYYGSIAAARLLGKCEIPVYFGDHRLLVPGKFSKYVDHKITTPYISHIDEFTGFLLSFGKENSGLVLYPTSDDMVWIIASKKNELEKLYKLYSPAQESIYSLLNKERLFKLSKKIGISCPETLFPESLSDIAKENVNLGYPCLIKPRTQMCFESKQKGKLCTSFEDLKKSYEYFYTNYLYHKDIITYDEKVVWPMLQAYHEEAMEHTYSLAGFMAKNGKDFSMRASEKVLQRPRKLGIGICFEGRPVVKKIEEQIVRLCHETGYFGAFEAEFIQVKGEFLLIDFNPRYYSQMAFEIARDIPMSFLTYLGAHKKDEEIERLLSQSRTYKKKEDLDIYSHEWLLYLLLTTQWLGGHMSFSERRKWLQWKDKEKKKYVDAVYDALDFWPWFVDFCMHIKHFMRHPRDFLRKYFGAS